MDTADKLAAQRRGVDAEQLVAEALKQQGWNEVARNWVAAGAELDLVVEREGAVRFVEVKARTDALVDPLESITADKRQRLTRAATAWLEAHPPVVDAAFLVAVVQCEEQPWRVDLWDDAFDGA